MRELAGKHAFVTGGNSGVGAAICETLIKSGAMVTITGRDEERLRAFKSRLPSLSYYVADVTDAAALRRAVEKAEAENGPISIVVANAGAAESQPFSKMTDEHWNDMLSVNLTGVFNTYQATLNSITKADSGRMIAIASTAGLKGYAYVSAYSAAKHGVIGLTRSLALELAQKAITVNAICPGYTETPMLERTLQNIMDKTGMTREEAIASLTADMPTKRLIDPEEVAETVLWLCSDGARSVTGQAISVSGGAV